MLGLKACGTSACCVIQEIQFLLGNTGLNGLQDRSDEPRQVPEEPEKRKRPHSMPAEHAQKWLGEQRRRDEEAKKKPATATGRNWLAIGVSGTRRGSPIGKVHLLSPNGDLQRIVTRDRWIRDLCCHGGQLYEAVSSLGVFNTMAEQRIADRNQ